MALQGKEKIWYMVHLIQGERGLYSAGEDIGIKKDLILGKYDQLDLQTVFSKLEKENAAKLIQTPTDQTWMRYVVRPLPDFDKYAISLEDDPEYLEWSGKKPKPKKYFGKENQVDFTKSKEQNKEKYISVGQIQELEEMTEAERTRIMSESLTDKHVKDINEFQVTSLKLVENIKKNYNLKASNLTRPTLSDVSFALPPNYEAETVGLLRQLVAANKEKGQPASQLIAPTYYKNNKQLVFCNKIIDVSKGRDFELLCNSMFYSEKPRSQPQQLGELLHKWQDPDHKNTKRVHNAVNNFNNFVAKFTTIDDLFYIKNKQVHFNSNYL